MYHNHRFLIAGDFNLLSINWNTDIPFPTNTLDLEFINCIMNNDLCHLVNKPTRSNIILDLVFVKESNDLVKCDIMPKLIASDHELLITFSYNECTSKLINNNFTSKYDFTNGNYVALNHSLLSIN